MRHFSKLSFLLPFLFFSTVGLANSVEVLIPSNDGSYYRDMVIVGVDDPSDPGRIEGDLLKGAVRLRYLNQDSVSQRIRQEIRVATDGSGKSHVVSTQNLLFRYANQITIAGQVPSLQISAMHIERDQDVTVVSFDREFLGISLHEPRLQMSQITSSNDAVGIDSVFMEVLPGLTVSGRFLIQENSAQAVLFSLNDNFEVRAPNSIEEGGCAMRLWALGSSGRFSLNEPSLTLSSDGQYEYIGSLVNWYTRDGTVISETTNVKQIKFAANQAAINGANGIC